jgi:cyclopropane fatty-acyl-phospholipid synthase-like methyltransferase
MGKGELIAAIRRLNRTVSVEFLQRFGEPDLRAYLERIAAVLPASSREADHQRTIDAGQELMFA